MPGLARPSNTSETVRLRRLTRRIVGAFQLTDPEREHPEDEIWRRIVEGLQGDDGRLLPRSLADALVALDGTTDDDRVRLALRLATNFDLVEMIGAALYVARNRQSFDALLTAAALAENPGVSAGLRSEVMALGDSLKITPRQRELLKVAVDSRYEPTTPPARRLRPVRWPGINTTGSAQALVAIHVTRSAPAGGLWLLAGELAAGGVGVRRVFPGPAPHSFHPWLGKRTVHVGWDESSDGCSDAVYVRLAAELFEPTSLAAAVLAISDRLQSLGEQPLRVDDVPRILSSPSALEGEAPRRDQRFSFEWPRYTVRIKQTVFNAVVSKLTDPIAMGAIQYTTLVHEGVTVAESARDGAFREIIHSLAYGDGPATFEQLITDSVSAAVSEMIKQGRVRWTIRNEALMKVP